MSGMMTAVTATLAIDAVKSADLPVGRHQINTQGDAETATMDRTENRRII